MALIFIDGFDSYNVINQDVSTLLADHWSSVENSGANSFVVKNGRYGGKGITINSDFLTNSSLISEDYSFSSEGEKIVFGFNFKLPQGSGDYATFTPFSSNINQGIRFHYDRIEVRRSLAGNADNLDFPLNLNSNWHAIEIECKSTNVASSLFSVNVYIDDIIVYRSPVDWVSTSGTSRFQVEDLFTTPLVIDDFYILDNTGEKNRNRLGSDFRIETLFASGVSGSSSWVPTSGDTLVSAVSGVPYDESIFVGVSGVNEIQQYLFDNLSGIRFSSGAQIRSVARGDELVDYQHVVSGIAVETFSINENFDSKYTIFDQGNLSIEQVNNLSAGVSS